MRVLFKNALLRGLLAPSRLEASLPCSSTSVPFCFPVNGAICTALSLSIPIKPSCCFKYSLCSFVNFQTKICVALSKVSISGLGTGDWPLVRMFCRYVGDKLSMSSAAGRLENTAIWFSRYWDAKPVAIEKVASVENNVKCIEESRIISQRWIATQWYSQSPSLRWVRKEMKTDWEETRRKKFVSKVYLLPDSFIDRAGELCLKDVSWHTQE